jgi:hypothetical protein
MTIDGVRIYNDGVGVGHDSEEKIRQIATTMKTLSPSSDVSLRVLKSGRTYEGLLWGKAGNQPIGVYNRGPSMAHVLDTLHRKVKKQCLKSLRRSGASFKPKHTFQTFDQLSLAMAG